MSYTTEYAVDQHDQGLIDRKMVGAALDRIGEDTFAVNDGRREESAR